MTEPISDEDLARIRHDRDNGVLHDMDRRWLARLDATTEKLAEAIELNSTLAADGRMLEDRLAAAEAALRRIADGAGNRGDYAIQIAEAYFAAHTDALEAEDG